MYKNKNKILLIGASLFSSAGIAEYFLNTENIKIIVANELVKERAELYTAQHPKTNMICGDILDMNVFNSIVEALPKKIDFLIASPPCQGMSVAGKNRTQKQMLSDERNFLIFKVIEIIKLKKPDYVIIENVPNFFKIVLPFKNKLSKVYDILIQIFGDEYIVKKEIYDASDYGIGQRRIRAIIRMYKKGFHWDAPKKSNKIKTVRDVIGKLPSIEAGESSDIKWHFARKHSPDHILCMKHTPTGESAIENPVFFPKKKNGERVKAYITTYKRMLWDEPAPTITIRNDAISSQCNVHPGRLKKDGTYSDARVLTPLELMLLSSLPSNWNIPDDTPELLIRKCIGEAIPPMLIKKIVEQIQR